MNSDHGDDAIILVRSSTLRAVSSVCAAVLLLVITLAALGLNLAFWLRYRNTDYGAVYDLWVLQTSFALSGNGVLAVLVLFGIVAALTDWFWLHLASLRTPASLLMHVTLLLIGGAAAQQWFFVRYLAAALGSTWGAVAPLFRAAMALNFIASGAGAVLVPVVGLFGGPSHSANLSRSVLRKPRAVCGLILSFGVAGTLLGLQIANTLGYRRSGNTVHDPGLLSGLGLTASALVILLSVSGLPLVVFAPGFFRRPALSLLYFGLAAFAVCFLGMGLGISALLWRNFDPVSTRPDNFYTEQAFYVVTAVVFLATLAELLPPDDSHGTTTTTVFVGEHTPLRG